MFTPTAMIAAIHKSSLDTGRKAYIETKYLQAMMLFKKFKTKLYMNERSEREYRNCFSKPGSNATRTQTQNNEKGKPTNIPTNAQKSQP